MTAVPPPPVRGMALALLLALGGWSVVTLVVLVATGVISWW